MEVCDLEEEPPSNNKEERLEYCIRGRPFLLRTLSVTRRASSRQPSARLSLQMMHGAEQLIVKAAAETWIQLEITLV